MAAHYLSVTVLSISDRIPITIWRSDAFCWTFLKQEGCHQRNQAARRSSQSFGMIQTVMLQALAVQHRQLYRQYSHRNQDCRRIHQREIDLAWETVVSRPSWNRINADLGLASNRSTSSHKGSLLFRTNFFSRTVPGVLELSC